MATILPTVSVMNYKPEPMMANFSSRGPSTLTKNILKVSKHICGEYVIANSFINNNDK